MAAAVIMLPWPISTSADRKQQPGRTSVERSPSIPATRYNRALCECVTSSDAASTLTRKHHTRLAATRLLRGTSAISYRVRRWRVRPQDAVRSRARAGWVPRRRLSIGGCRLSRLYEHVESCELDPSSKPSRGVQDDSARPPGHWNVPAVAIGRHNCHPGITEPRGSPGVQRPSHVRLTPLVPLATGQFPESAVCTGETEVIRRRKEQRAARSQDAGQFSDRAAWSRYVLDRLAGDHQIERLVWMRDVFDVANVEGEPRSAVL